MAAAQRRCFSPPVQLEGGQPVERHPRRPMAPPRRAGLGGGLFKRRRRLAAGNGRGGRTGTAGPCQNPPGLAEIMEGMTRPDRYRWAAPDDEEQPVAVLALGRLYGQQGDSEEWARPRDDPYAENSLVLGGQLSLPTFSEDRRGTRRLVMKRKVLRHRPDGGVEVSDESVTSEVESEAEVWSLRQKTLQRRTSPEDSISEGEIETSSSSLDESPRRWPRGESPPSLLGDLGSRSSPASQYAAVVGQPKSFIPPRFEPLGHNRGKTDPVAKYFEYKREWEKFRIPGEDRRQELRWGIREQMLCQPELPVKPRRPTVPNAYTVPTEKKRAALRWEVRWDLANGLLPRKNTSS
ncbi:LOW QUALITY PROTEIN: centriolar and ciliogenesis-associated protein HYLS1 [Haliaeetus albicilla]